jgi:D-alanyl-D-alanine carboxypeptidase
MSAEPPFGSPGASGMQYANTNFVLLGEIAARVSGRAWPELLREQLLDPLALHNTGFAFEMPQLAHAYTEFNGQLLDVTDVPQRAIVSFAGAAGALHSDVADLLRYTRALLAEAAVLGPASIEVMKTPAEPNSWYGHALMRLCPCTQGAEGTDYLGLGHGGNMPGYWSMAAHYPSEGLTAVVMINRDVIDGIRLERTALEAILEDVTRAFHP